jgi:hypothetical protein
LRSAASLQLREALELYCRGQTGGRSFAISGLRGVGKTTMVLTAVEELSELSRESDQPFSIGDERADGAWLRRPLLVRLSAPDILRTPLPSKNDTEPDATANLVRQLARGLHLAATKEFAQCYRARLFDAPAPRSTLVPRQQAVGGLQAERFEAAAQLGLELSRGARADAVRRFWELSQSFGSGVLFKHPRMPDQGVRELAALDLSALAFQIAVGTYSEDTDGDDATKFEGEGASKVLDQLKAAAGPFGGVLSGIATGVGTGLKAHTFEQGMLAAAAGLGVAITFTLFATPVLTRNRSAKWSFKPDTTEGSLIWRLERAVDLFFDAGLAVVFVVDELDKVDREMLVHAKQAATRSAKATTQPTTPTASSPK